MKYPLRSTVYTLALFLGITITCEQQYSNPVAVDPETFPGQPIQINARVGDRLIHLSWSPLEPTDITAYRIYRQDQTGSEYVVIAEPDAPPFVDADVHNESVYQYRISSVNSNGYEGPLSDPIQAIPGTYAVSINNGADFTNSPQVTLSTTAPVGARLMQISNDSLPAAPNWSAFASTQQWRLSPGNGDKTVWVRFRDADGNDTADHISDSIKLDTRATIETFFVQDLQSVYTAGDTLSLHMITGEPWGNATVDIGSEESGLVMYDDGTHGDMKAEDGHYVLDYIILPQFDAQEIDIVGQFTDNLGNKAPEVNLVGVLTVLNPPAPVQLFPAQLLATATPSVHLSWTRNNDSDFLSYHLYKSLSPHVDSTSALVSAFTVKQQTTAVDSGVQSDQTYYYRLYVTDIQGLSTGSNTVQITVPSQPGPDAVQLSPPTWNMQTNEVMLSWEPSSATRFALYRVFRSLDYNIDDSGIPLSSIDQRLTTFYRDGDLKSETTYYYRVYVYDQNQKRTGSNIVSLTTPANSPPDPVQLAIPTRTAAGILTLNWSQNRNSDFESYRIYVSTAGQINPSQAPVTIINAQTTTSYTHLNLQAGQVHTYQIFVFDQEGLSTGSNIVNATP
jgi:fibronectin type 3 domain-containing protein